MTDLYELIYLAEIANEAIREYEKRKAEEDEELSTVQGDREDTPVTA